MGYHWRGDERKFIISELRLGTRINDIALMLGRTPVDSPPRYVGRRVSNFLYRYRPRDVELQLAYEAWLAKQPKRRERDDRPRDSMRAARTVENSKALPTILHMRGEGHTASEIAHTLGPGWTRGRVLGLIYRRRGRRGE